LPVPFLPWEKMEKVLKFVDLVLFDIKHLDPLEHKRTTSVGNELILEKPGKRLRDWHIYGCACLL